MEPISIFSGTGGHGATLRVARESDPMFIAARKFEAGFVAEMLKSAGLGKTRDSFGGGAGEDGFSSFLVRIQAEEITKGGGLGLSETIFNALKLAEENDAGRV